MKTYWDLNCRTHVSGKGHAKAERVMCGNPSLNGCVATHHACAQ